MEETPKLKSDALPRKPSVVWVAMKKVKTKLSLTDEGATPVNWKIIFLVFISLFSSSFNITFIFPFLPEMIKTFGYKEEDKGFYAGIVASALFVGRAFGSYFWGWLSDKKGRRPIILLTLLLNGVFSLAFGFTTNIYFAFITRVLAGLTNGTVGAAKTVLYEISDNTNQAVGMSIISIAWGSGLIFGPVAGGYLANPCKQYPEAFPPEGLLYQFPYFFPGMCAFVLCLIAFIIDFFMLPETLNKKASSAVEAMEPDVLNTDEKTSLHSSHGLSPDSPPSGLPAYLRGGKPKAALSVENLHMEAEGATYLASARKEIHITLRGISITDDPDSDDETSKPTKPGSASPTANHTKQHFYIQNEDETLSKSAEDISNLKAIKDPVDLVLAKENGVTETLLPQNGKNGVNGVNGSLGATEKNNNAVAGSGCWYKFKNWRIVKLMTNYEVFLAVFLYSAFSFSVIGVDEIFTVWASTDVILDGLGFEPQQIGTVLGTTSLPLLFIQLFLFPNLVRRIGIKKTLIICCTLLFVLTDIMPMLHLLVNRPVALWVLLLSIYTLIKLMISCTFSCTGLFINNSVAPDLAGTVNGIAMTITAISRSFAPIMGGSIFSWVVGYASDNIGPPFDVSLVFFIFGLVYFFCVLMGVIVPESLNKQKK